MKRVDSNEKNGNVAPSFGLDITEHKRMEERLRESEEKYRSMIELAPDAIVTLNMKGIITSCNTATARISGYSKAEIVGKHFSKPGFLQRSDMPKYQKLFSLTLRGKVPKPLEVTWQSRDGTPHVAGILVSLMKKDGKTTGIQAIARDITDRKKVEEALKKSEEKFRNIFGNANDAMIFLDSSGRILDVNRKAMEVFGGSKNEVLGKHFTKVGVVSLKDIPRLVSAFAKGLSGRKATLTLCIKNKKNQEIHLECLGSLAKIDDKLTVLVVARDVTERMRAEEALRKSEEKHRSLVELAPDIIVTSDLKGVITSFNTAGTRISGYSKDEVVGKHFSKIGHVRPQDLPKYLKMLNSIVRGKAPKPLEVIFYHKDGTPRLVEVHVSLLKQNDKSTGILSIIRDITERKKMEEALQKSEELFRSLFNNMAVGAALVDKNGYVLAANEADCRFLGYSQKEIVGMHFSEFTYSEDLDVDMKLFDDLIKGKRSNYVIEKRYVRKDGKIVWGRLNVSLIRDDHGRPKYTVVVCEDITERKRAEEELRFLKEFNERIVDSIGDALLVIDPNNYTILGANEAVLKQLKFGKKGLIGRTCYETIHHSLTPCRQPNVCPIQEMLETGKSVTVEHTHFDRDNNKVFVEVSAHPMRNQEGNMVQVVHLAKDITERKKAEEELRESEERYRTLFEKTASPILVIDTEGGYIDCNEAALKFVECTRDELLTKNIRDFIPPGKEREVLEEHRPLWDSGGTVETEYYVHGKVKILGLTITPAMWQGKRVIFGVGKDITDRKRAEEALRKSEEHARRLLEFQSKVIDTAVAWINLLDTEGNVTLWNRAAELISGYSREEVAGHKKIWEWLYPEPKYRAEAFAETKKVIKEGERHENYHTTIRCKDGTSKTISWYSNNILDEKGNPVGLIAIGIDITEIKTAQEKVRESEEKYRNLFENARDIIVTFDLKRNVTSINKAAEEYGFKKDDLLGKSMLRFVSRRYWPRLLKELVDIARGKPVEGEIEIITPIGKRVAEYKSNPINQDNKVVGLQTIMRDITERRKMEEALRESEERFRDAVANTGEWVWEVDANGKYTYASPVVEQVLGYTPEEVLGKHFYDFFVPDEREKLKDAALKVFERKERFINFVNRNVHKKGHVVILETSGVPILAANGQLLGYRGADRDVTERKMLEGKLKQYSEHLEELVRKRTEELLESEKRYSVLVEEASDGVAIIQDGKIVFANKRTSEITGYSREELLGLSAVNLLREGDRQPAKEKYMQRLRGETVPTTYEIELIAKSGELIPVELSTNLINYQGQPSIIVVVRDIRERKRMEEQRLKLEKLATIGELATMVAHDLRNPLTSIRNASFYIKNTCPCRGGPECKTAIEMLDIIEQETLFANNIINDLLDFAAIRPIQKERRDINEMIEDSITTSNIPENIKVERNFARKAIVNVDEKQLDRVFSNLVKNAVQAMPKGGKLTITTNETEDHVEIALTDTGVGIPEESMSKLFQPLFTTKAKGIGMGLAICKKIVEQHDGTIDVKSKVGEGTTFVIKLPKKEETNSP